MRISDWSSDVCSSDLRMKPSGVRFIVNRYPLIERDITRRDCEHWLAQHGYPIPPKSACVQCAFQSDAEWSKRKDRKSGVQGKSVSVRVDLGGRRHIKKEKKCSMLCNQIDKKKN